MSDTMFVKPSRAGLIVRDPTTKEPVPDEGRDVPRNSFWTRRLTGGDVVTAPRPETATAQPSAASAKAVRGNK
ncbi:DUF2635 domain-containing protein [Desulfocurvibacter africanus]|uniref:DUF2635 domain-containing protein n=1 Tax=Desulfocurvibacter africanus subsp. africanus str. Walvis Bay TaxID=690850 RepID=F3Z2T3_DESAF|nr:DUF2635 domain-containing protein [Desulfocurvibacter africanus]EGJ50250.1 hypothetical protein Desaf_1921 [Desulfocurvibacter africanus subsp. africanus str. Walvis Bay]